MDNLKKLSQRDGRVKKYMEELKRVNKNPKFRVYMTYEEDERKKEILNFMKQEKKVWNKEKNSNK